MTRVLILWADSRSANFGVRVLAEGMRELALQAWGPETQVDFQDYGAGDSDVSFGARSIARDLRSRSGPIRSKLRRYDIVLDSGAGDSFTDIYGWKRLITMLYAQQVAATEKIPIAMGPQTVGPFNRRLSRALARRSLLRMRSVTARDSASLAYARDMGRIDAVHSTDVVFALKRSTITKSRDVIVNVSGLLWFENSHVSSASYRSSVRELIDRLQSDGRAVSLLAHVRNRVSAVDDAAAISELLTSYSDSIEVVLPESLDQVRSALGSARLVIGSRMHACLNALSMGTPAIPWAYSRKFEPLLNDLGWSHAYDLRLEPRIVDRTMADVSAATAGSWDTEVSSVLARADDRLTRAVVALRQVHHAA